MIVSLLESTAFGSVVILLVTATIAWFFSQAICGGAAPYLDAGFDGMSADSPGDIVFANVGVVSLAGRIFKHAKHYIRIHPTQWLWQRRIDDSADSRSVEFFSNATTSCR